MTVTSYKFRINESGIVQKVSTAGTVEARLTMREMTRIERIRANKRITYARSYSYTMAEKRAAMGKPPAHTLAAPQESTQSTHSTTRYHNGRIIA